MTTDINAFANQWLREQAEGTTIEGFGPPESPPPPPLDFEDVTPMRQPEPDDQEPEPTSPLLALGAKPATVPPFRHEALKAALEAAQAPLSEQARAYGELVLRGQAQFDVPAKPAAGQSLSGLGDAGHYRGTQATLSKQDQAAIGRIILESAHRKLREQLAEVMKAAPRRARKQKVHVGPIALETAPEPETPKKRRGRPPKAQA